MASGVDKALKLLRDLPRVTIGNLKPLPGTRRKKVSRRGQNTGVKCGKGSKGQGQRNTLPRIGFEGGQTPFYLVIPKEPYYKGHHVRRQYPPVTLLELQRLVDVGFVDTKQPIDLTALCNTKIINVDHKQGQYGINLTDEGSNIFQAKVNIEVQWTDEPTIAAIEKNGGTIVTKFYDLTCIKAMADPALFFSMSNPIPRVKLPPEDALKFYTDPKFRGYLADPDKVAEARIELAQKYGYELPDVDTDPDRDMLLARKDPRQIWFGLEPGWMVNLKDKVVLKPSHEKFQEYYRS